MKTKLFYSIVLSLLFCLGYAQTVSLDESFGNGGKVVTNLGETNDYINSLFIDENGKIIVCGSKQSSINSEFYSIFLLRFNSDGTLDATFGSNGIVETPLTSSHVNNYKMKITNVNKILVTGSVVTGSGLLNSYDFALMQYNSNGTIDENFGINGMATIDFIGLNDYSDAVDVLSDNSIIIAGKSEGSNISGFYSMSLVKFNQNGELDTTFGINGKKVLTTYGNESPETVRCVKVLENDTILLGSYFPNMQIFPINYIDFGLVKVDNNGNLVSEFGENGYLITNFGGTDLISAIDVIDNNIFVCGSSSLGSVYTKMVIAKYNQNGDFDISFGNNGIVKINKNETTSFDNLTSLKIKNDGKLLFTGLTSSNNVELNKSLLIQFNPNGSIDTSFNNIGFIYSDGINLEVGLSLALQSDGKIVTCGALKTNNNYHSLLSRYTFSNLSNSNFEKKSFSISPNPVSEKINIQFQLIQPETISIDLFDMQGRKINQLMKETSFGNEYHNLEIILPTEISKGIYFIKISNGYQQQSLKIIKE